MLLVCICTGLSKAINPKFVAFEAVSFRRIQRTRIVIFNIALQQKEPSMWRAAYWTTWLLILGSCASASGQARIPQVNSVPEKVKPYQAFPQTIRILLTARTVLVVGESFVLYPTSKSAQTFKKALAKWGHFHLVDDVDSADLVIVVSEYSSSKPTRMERVSEELIIFAGGDTPTLGTTPLWTAKEVGPALGQRPTAKLVDDLRKSLSTLEKSAPVSSPTSPM